VATKKQKREAVMAKRERRLAEERESGLKALCQDHENRDKKRRKEQKEKHDKEHSWKKREPTCLLCQDALEEQRRQERALYAE
jgi:hypothetical protein